MATNIIYHAIPDGIIAEARQLNEQADALKAKLPSIAWNESINEILKSKKNNPIRWQILTKIDREWLWDLEKSGIEILTDGWLRIIRWNKQPSKNAIIIKQKVIGINSAIRMQDHILGGYREDQIKNQAELSKLESIEEVIEKANSILTDWQNLNLAYDHKMIKQLIQVILLLEKCTNEFKVRARRQVEKIIDLRDSLGRVNPGAMATRTLTALNSLSSRINEIGNIYPKIALRKEILIFEKRRIQDALRKAISKTAFIPKSASPAGKLNPADETKIIMRNFEQALFFLNNNRVSPYWEQTEQVKYYYWQAKKLRRQNNFLAAGEMVKTALEILRTDMDQYG